MAWRPRAQDCSLWSITWESPQYIRLSGDMLLGYRQSMQRMESNILVLGQRYDQCTRIVGGRSWAILVASPPNHTELFIPWQLLVFCLPNSCTASSVRYFLAPFSWLLLVTGRWGETNDAQTFESVVKESLLAPLVGHEHTCFGRCRQAIYRQTFVEHGIDTTILELGSWAEFGLSWAIIGFGGCGTSSLARNIHQLNLAELIYRKEMQDFFEDGFFFSSPRIHPGELPIKATILQYQSGFGSISTKGIQAPRGVKCATYIKSPLALTRLLQIPKMRVIVMVHDPVVLLERDYLKNFAECKARNASFVFPRLAACLDGPCGPVCDYRTSTADFGTMEKYSIKLGDWLMSERIRAVKQSFGNDRVFLADRFHLQFMSFYTHVATFLGVPPPVFKEDFILGANMNHGARFSTHKLKRRFLLEGTVKRRAHDRTVGSLQDRCAGERLSLAVLMSELPPRFPCEEWPPWLKVDLPQCETKEWLQATRTLHRHLAADDVNILRQQWRGEIVKSIIGRRDSLSTHSH